MDTVIPSVESVKVVNPKVIEIYTSEPVQLSSSSFTSLSSIKIDGVNAIAKVTADHSKNKYTVELNNALSAGQHTIKIADIKDFANFKVNSKEFTVTVQEDTTAPSVVSAKVVDKDTVEVTFNEAIATSGSTPVGTFKINGTTYVPTLKSGTVDTIVIDNISPVLDLGALVEVKFEYVNVKDLLDNEVKETQTYKFSAEDDTTAPTVTAEFITKAGELNHLKLTFNKSMLTNTGTIELKDKDNKVVASLSASDADWTEENKVATFTASELNLDNVNPGTYTLKVKDFVDTTLRANEIADTEVTLNAVDTKAPTVNANYIEVKAETASQKAQVKVSFNEAMDTATLNNLANYHVGTGTTVGAFTGTRLDQVSGAKIVEVASDKKSVVIELPKDQYDETAGNTTTIKVEGVRDLAGNLISTTVVSSAKTLAPLAVTSVKATGENTIEVTFDREIASVDPSVFTVQNEDDDPITNVSNAVIDSSDAKKVILTTVSKLPHNLVKDSKALELDIAGSNKIVDVYGIKFSSDALDNAITDAIRPEVVSIKGSTAGNDVDQFEITFSEAIDADIALTDIVNDILVKDTNGKTIAIASGDLAFDANKKVLTVTLRDADPTNDEFAGTYTVQVLDRVIKDEDGGAGTGTNVVKGKTVTNVVVK